MLGGAFGDDAAAIDGANKWRIFTSIVIPLVSPMVYLVLIVVALTLMLNAAGRWLRGYGQEES